MQEPCQQQQEANLAPPLELPKINSPLVCHRGKKGEKGRQGQSPRQRQIDGEVKFYSFSEDVAALLYPSRHQIWSPRPPQGRLPYKVLKEQIEGSQSLAPSPFDVGSSYPDGMLAQQSVGEGEQRHPRPLYPQVMEKSRAQSPNVIDAYLDLLPKIPRQYRTWLDMRLKKC